MTRALYLRPAGLATWPHFDDQVKAWLREQGIEPVDAGDHEEVVCLPYCGGGGYYHRDVSIEMAQRIVDMLAIGGEVRWIHLRSTEVDWKDDSLEKVRLEFEEHGYAGKATLAIMSPDEVAEADREIREEGQLGHHDLGVRWRPKPPPAPRDPQRPMVLAISDEEVAMLRRVAAADVDGNGILCPAEPNRTLEWLSGMGLFQRFEHDGKPAYRITAKGRIAAREQPAA